MPINIGGADDELKGVSFADDINSFLALSIYLSPSLENLVLYTIHMITVKRSATCQAWPTKDLIPTTIRIDIIDIYTNIARTSRLKK